MYVYEMHRHVIVEEMSFCTFSLLVCDQLQELFAYGITSVCNSFFSGYSPSGSLSRSVVQETTGGKTQLVGLISSSILLAVIYVVAPLFEPLPKVHTVCCI